MHNIKMLKFCLYIFIVGLILSIFLLSQEIIKFESETAEIVHLIQKYKRTEMYDISKITNSKRILTMTSTAYEASPVSCGPYATGYTATGHRAMVGVVAVDPRIIPLGTVLFIENYGVAVALDTGGAIKGHKIDVFFNTVDECLQWGRRKVDVHILEIPNQLKLPPKR